MSDESWRTFPSARRHPSVTPAARVRGFSFTALACVLSVAATVGALGPPFSAEGQPAKVYRIGVLGWSPRAQYEERGYLEAFREDLRRLGWVEGRNLLIEYRFADGKADRLPNLVAELADLQLDLILTITTTVTLAAQKAIKATPIVFSVTDALGAGIVPHLARPGGNVTGPSSLAPEVSGKSLELLREVVPRLARVAVLWEPGSRGTTLAFHQVKNDAQKLDGDFALPSRRGAPPRRADRTSVALQSAPCTTRSWTGEVTRRPVPRAWARLASRLAPAGRPCY